MSVNISDVVTIKHAADSLNLTPAALYLAIKEGRVSSITALGRIAIPRKEFDRLKRKKVKRSKNSTANGHK
jgi:hypothetical protein